MLVDFLKFYFRDLVELCGYQVHIEAGDFVLVWLVYMAADVNVVFINLAKMGCAKMFVAVVHKCSVTCYCHHQGS